MHEFTALRARAKERRDLAIKAARLSYEAAMTAIAELENRLSVGMTSRTQSQTRLNFGLPLSSRAFTIVEIMEGLEALDPARVWNKAAVANIVTAWRQLVLAGQCPQNR